MSIGGLIPFTAVLTTVVILLYVVQRSRANDLVWARDFPRILALVAGIAGFVIVLSAPDPIPAVSIPIVAFAGGIYLLRSNPSPQGRFGGWALVVAAGAALLSLALRSLLQLR